MAGWMRLRVLSLVGVMNFSLKLKSGASIVRKLMKYGLNDVLLLMTAKIQSVIAFRIDLIIKGYRFLWAWLLAISYNLVAIIKRDDLMLSELADSTGSMS